MLNLLFMTFFNQSGKKDESGMLLRNRIEMLGAREIYLWKEMVLRDESLFSQIYALIYCDQPRIAWHAAWVIDHVSEADPGKLEPYIPELIDQLPKLKSSSLKRHFTRMINRHEIPENQLGMLIDVLYGLLSPSEAIAVRANTLEILHKIALKEPDLQAELISVTEAILEEELTPGMLSKGKKILRSLRQH
jgi:hypothetical protein